MTMLLMWTRRKLLLFRAPCLTVMARRKLLLWRVRVSTRIFVLRVTGEALVVAERTPFFRRRTSRATVPSGYGKFCAGPAVLILPFFFSRRLCAVGVMDCNGPATSPSAGGKGTK